MDKYENSRVSLSRMWVASFRWRVIHTCRSAIERAKWTQFETSFFVIPLVLSIMCGHLLHILQPQKPNSIPLTSEYRSCIGTSKQLFG